MLGIADFLVHQTVDQTHAAVNGEGCGQFLVRGRKIWRVRFIAQFGNAQNFFAVLNRDA